MKFSTKTLSILKNFQSINPSLVFNEGSEIRTISTAGTLYACSTIEEKLPKNACIYELSKLLSVISLYDEPEINFTDKWFEIVDSSKKKKTKITYTEPSMVVAPKEGKYPKIHDIEVQISLSKEDIMSILKAGSTLNLEDFVILSDGETMSIGATNVLDNTSDNYFIELGESEANFRYVVKIEYMKFIPDDYIITVGSGKISFKSDSVEYYIALESKKTIK